MNITRLTLISATLIAMGLSPAPRAAGGHDSHESHKMHGEKVTMTGEIVDMTCYLGHGAKGNKHMSCADACINRKGLPMGLLTQKGDLYLIVEDQAKDEAYQKLKSKAAETVTLKGKKLKKGGIQAISVRSFE